MRGSARRGLRRVFVLFDHDAVLFRRILPERRMRILRQRVHDDPVDAVRKMLRGLRLHGRFESSLPKSVHDNPRRLRL